MDWEFYALGRDKGEKATRLAIWNQVYNTSGIMPEGLANKPELNPDAEYIIEIYAEIKKGADCVGYHEIYAYQQVTGHRLNAIERGLLFDIDQIRRKHG